MGLNSGRCVRSSFLVEVVSSVENDGATYSGQILKEGVGLLKKTRLFSSFIMNMEVTGLLFRIICRDVRRIVLKTGFIAR
jgi:hypothetical protein